MLPRSRRIFSERDYRRVGRLGRVARGRLLHVRTLPNNLSHHRLGIIVGKKVSKKAVDRNRLKRRLRHLAPKLPSGKSRFDIVIIVQPAAQKATSAELLKDLAALRLTTLPHEKPRHPHY